MPGPDAIGTQLDIFLANHAAPDIAGLLGAVARAATPVAALIRRGALAGNLAAATGDANNDGDAQKFLDVAADRAFIDGLRGHGVRALISEEQDKPVALDADGRLLVAIDPLDGSSNIDTNISIGTIFSVLDAAVADGPVEAREFLQAGNRQRAAGFVMYGPQTTFIFTAGAGAHVATYDPDARDWFMTRLSLTIPQGSTEYAINASNYRHWPKPIQAYVDECIAGAEGPRGKNFNMRWVAALVCDAYRVLVRGGIYLYPADERRGYEKGRLRHCYEASPIAFIIEQAGGAATDGVRRILDIEPHGIHDRAPLIFGSLDKVEGVRRHYLRGDHPADRSPLFSNRGLLRS